MHKNKKYDLDVTHMVTMSFMSFAIVFFLFSSDVVGRVYKEKAKFFETNYRLVKKLIEKNN